MSPPPNNVLPSPCPWISCPVSPTIWTEARFTAHLEEHWADTLRRWSGPRKCDWLNCKSKATFKSPASLKSHILNIHVTPLVCTHPQCTYTKPFGKESDLSRHVETVHEKADRHKCPVELCEAHITGFARKDKLLNHIREQHDNLRCPFNHCFATVLEIQQESHLQRFHGSFECALGACETGLASCFLEANFRSHLRKHHNISYDAVLALMRTLRSTKDNTARGYHIVRLRKWQDCPVCSNVPSSGYVEDIQSHNE
jgi:hypothetical protein